jgi:hypothetical protein
MVNFTNTLNLSTHNGMDPNNFNLNNLNTVIQKNDLVNHDITNNLNYRYSLVLPNLLPRKQNLSD